MQTFDSDRFIARLRNDLRVLPSCDIQMLTRSSANLVLIVDETRIADGLQARGTEFRLGCLIRIRRGFRRSLLECCVCGQMPVHWWKRCIRLVHGTSRIERQRNAFRAETDPSLCLSTSGVNSESLRYRDMYFELPHLLERGSESAG
jgi:hypothetical protein